MALTAGLQSGRMEDGGGRGRKASVQLFFFFFNSIWVPSCGMVTPIFGVGLASSVKLPPETTLEELSELCLLGSSKSVQLIKK